MIQGVGEEGTVYCVKRVENESVIVFMPVPVVWMPACCVDRSGRLGHRAMWLLGVASWHL